MTVCVVGTVRGTVLLIQNDPHTFVNVSARRQDK